MGTRRGSGQFGVLHDRDRRQAGLALNQESLTIYRELGDLRGEGQALLGRATAHFAQGRLAETRELLSRSHELLLEAEDHYFALFCSVFHSRIAMLMGDIDAGLAGYHAVLEGSLRSNLRLGIAVGLARAVGDRAT